MAQAKQLLDYVASQEEAVLTFSASEMKLAVHSDAGYLNEPNARSRAGGHFFLSNDADVPPNNGAILNISHVIKHVMSSATEAELAGLYIMAQEAVYIRIILEEMGHKQSPTPVQTDNAIAEQVIDKKVQPKRKKRWTCDSIGYAIANANDNSDSTGDQASSTTQTIGQNITLQNTTTMCDETI
ncbi:hypothetical protein THAOC_16272 [Thalassiosira oceanica]|uniref:Reverse transcriptase Ty1/copia-type domain-containing protein n=1 Tax=Thalassiosira oceanica TaxID=159749 RepID=K0SAC8_THAOC|nr:hypothetical protein THAOC_16272 [Thalassiosira oceanica]|eukprot:EJK63093.1 hypothetical protein THAOC_16272 [Thalassiosira oceanica]